MILEYFVKNVYGTDLCYLVDIVSREAWHELTGKQTISKLDMVYLGRLTGVEFKRVDTPDYM